MTSKHQLRALSTYWGTFPWFRFVVVTFTVGALWEHRWRPIGKGCAAFIKRAFWVVRFLEREEGSWSYTVRGVWLWLIRNFPKCRFWRICIWPWWLGRFEAVEISALHSKLATFILLVIILVVAPLYHAAKIFLLQIFMLERLHFLFHHYSLVFF